MAVRLGGLDQRGTGIVARLRVPMAVGTRGKTWRVQIIRARSVDRKVGKKRYGWKCERCLLADVGWYRGWVAGRRYRANVAAPQRAA